MDAEPKGYLHSKMDVKVLILFILSRIDTPLTVQELYEIAYQDESLNYFTFVESLPELAATGHLQQSAENRYVITEKGRKQGADVEDSLALPVIEKVSAAITDKQVQLRRDSFIRTSVRQDEDGYWIVTLQYTDDHMPMMSLSLMAPNQEIGETMATNLRRSADKLYQINLEAAIDSQH